MASSSCAITWFENELLITNDGCPVALPRLSRRPSDSTMTDRSGRSPSAGKVHSCTWGLISVRTIPGTAARPAMSISLSKCPMFPTIALSFIAAMWSTRMTSLLPVVVMKKSASSSTSSIRATS